MMSETKHAPLPPTPWMRAFAEELDPDLILVLASDASHVLLIRTATTQQRRALSYLLDSVNARPKVEELVKAVIMADQGDLEQADRANKLAREVEAALRISPQKT